MYYCRQDRILEVKITNPEYVWRLMQIRIYNPLSSIITYCTNLLIVLQSNQQYLALLLWLVMTFLNPHKLNQLYKEERLEILSLACLYQKMDPLWNWFKDWWHGYWEKKGFMGLSHEKLWRKAVFFPLQSFAGMKALLHIS